MFQLCSRPICCLAASSPSRFTNVIKHCPLSKYHQMNKARKPNTADSKVNLHPLAQAALEVMDSDHKRAIARKLLIEKRKEEQETLLLEQERAEELRKAQAAREHELQEERRR